MRIRSRHIHLVQAAIDVMADADVRLGSERVLIMCSGGLDSVALVDVIGQLPYQLRPQQIIVCWLDHGLRLDTQAEQQAAQQAAQKVGAGFVARTRPSAEIDRDANTQDAARAWRYQQAAAIAREHGCTYVLTAHTASDAAEHAVLGLVGVLPPASRIATLSVLDAGDEDAKADSDAAPLVPALLLLRPLLSASREQIADHVEARRLAYGEDPTNAQVDYDRNYVRHEILSRLLSRWPGAMRAMIKAQQQRTESDEALSGFVQLWLDQHSTVPKEAGAGSCSALDKQAFTQLALPMRQAVIAQWLAHQVAPRLYSRRHVLDIAQLRSPRLHLRGGYEVQITKDAVTLSRHI